MSELEPTITEHEPTATERLRALLDERGVEWDADDEAMDDGSLSQVTYWYCNGIEWSADGRDEYLAFDAVQLLTPEQAIAATLGSCNCSNDCTSSERTGTCHDKNGFDPDTGFECTVCGAMTDGYMVTTEDTGHFTQFNFCPNCGRRVVDDG
jgi:hypothetical protein